MIALVFGGLFGGGIERSMLRTAGELVSRGFDVTLIVREAGGDLVDAVPPAVRVVVLDRVPVWRGHLEAARADPSALLHILTRGASNRVASLPHLARALRELRPEAILAAAPASNILAVWARSLAGIEARLVVSQRNLTSSDRGARGSDRRWPPALVRHAYLQADAIAAVSVGAADDLAATTGIPRERITPIYNPVFGPELLRLAEEPVDHPWLMPGEPPIVLGVGRIHPVKDFPTLIRAFAELRRHRPARLVILGGAPANPADRAHLALVEALPRELGIADDVALLGFVSNPLAWMRRAGVFALSSTQEGFGNVLVEAMACGCPVVSTDTMSGPAEILDHGRFGRLVPRRDPEALARALGATLDEPPPVAALRARAAEFSITRSVDRYLELLMPHAAREAIEVPGELAAALRA